MMIDTSKHHFSTGFVIKMPNGKIQPQTFSYRSCKKAFTGGQNWNDWYKHGWRCVKVNVTMTELKKSTYSPNH